MKLIVSLVASNSEIFDQFKAIWVNYIIKIKELYPDLDICFYFLYSEVNVRKNNIISHFTQDDKLLYCNFYDEDIIGENDRIRYISKSMFKRTLKFFNYLKDTNLLNNDTYVLRTNLTTLFDFNKLMNWLSNKPRNLFIGGSFNGGYQENNTSLSGTNMIMSSDVINYLTNVPYNIEYLKQFSEDEIISLLVIQHLSVYIINIKRLDLIEISAIPNLNIPYIKPTICYHKCYINDESIFSFRFCTHDRLIDIDCMNILSNEINGTSTLNSYVSKIIDKYNFDLTTETPEYAELFSENTFKINTNKYFFI